MNAPAPVYGLVLAGGASRRMRTDKAQIAYHGAPQLKVAFDLLARHVERCFVSVRPEQRDEPLRASLPQIVDTLDAIGPAAGILAAQTAYPEASWLVLACDLPLLDEATLSALLDAHRREPQRAAIAYASSHDGLPEPLCALWRPASHAALLAQVESGRYCPRKVLLNIDTLLLPARSDGALDNINTPDELDQVQRRLEETT
jgi:molybdopterin-guanine dinucleotide biosynthesis protein A